MKKKAAKRAPKKSAKAKLSAFPIVGVGASAGGLQALTRLVSKLPLQSGIAIVIVQHLDPSRASDLPKILARVTKIPVFEVEDQMAPLPDCIYIIPPNFNLILVGNLFKLIQRNPEQKINLPVDLFFHSLAEQRKSKAIGVVLSGTGSDGTQGLLAIKSEGGISFAQDSKTAGFDGMPKSAIAVGAVDFILPPEKIAEELFRIAKHPYLTLDMMQATALAEIVPQPKLKEGEKALRRIFAVLQKNTHVDFENYKRSTFLRRLARRLIVVKIRDLETYAHYLESAPAESKLLFADILIHVTRFFRDEKIYETLKHKYLPKYLKNRDQNSPIRVWIPGCATGEEAYTLAITLLEYLEENKMQTPIQIFASDISEQALKIARAGIYVGIENDVTKDRLDRFFEKLDSGYRISKRVRETCLFSLHDVTRDPPFAKNDIISCRNLLIYFDSELQKRVLPVFHYALKPNGILLLGQSETIGDFSDIFSLTEKTQKIYVKKNVSRPPKLQFSPSQLSIGKLELNQISAILSRSRTDILKEADRIALLDYAPPNVVINDALDILQVRGRVVPYLELPQGQTSFKLLKMARPEIVSQLRSMINKARIKNVPVEKENLQLSTGGGFHHFNVKVVPLPSTTSSKDRYYTVFFEDNQRIPRNKTPLKSGKTTGKKEALEKSTAVNVKQLKDLHSQLAASQEYQQALVEDFEDSQEQLMASNEELQSINEELQSTNEELETAKEELQSTNEELTTVNDELSVRNSEMKMVSSDLINLLTSIDMAILMVGPDARIRRFTPRAGKMLKLIPTDVGRSIGDIKPDIRVQNLEELILEVMDTMIWKEIETQSGDSNWYKLQIRPYRTAENKIDGAVVSLVDIDALKRSIDELRHAHEDAVTIIETMPIPLLMMTSGLKVKLANQAFYDKFQVTRNDTEGRLISELGNGQWANPALLQQLDRTISDKINFDKFEVEHNFPSIGKKIVLVSANSAHLPGSGAYSALVAIEDVTEIKFGERKLKSSEERYLNLLTSSFEGIMVLRQDGTIEFANPQLEKIFGYEPTELLGKNYLLLFTCDESFFTNRDLAKEILVSGNRKDGSIVPISISFSHFKSNSEVLTNCTIRDITEQKNIDATKKALLAQEKELLSEAEKTNRIKDEFLATLSHELRTPLTAILGWAQELKNSNLDEKTVSDGLAVIERSAQAQGQLINDLLDISRIQSSKLPLDMKVIDVAKILNVGADSIRQLAENKSVAIEKNIELETCTIFADSTRLQQVLWNLLTNSVKFTPGGGKINVVLKSAKTQNGENAVIKIIDTGLGIKPEFLPQLFQRFSQADSSTARTYGGLGLGLAIAKSLVEMQNGKITAESDGEGKGATFTITLPMIVERDKAVKKNGEPAEQLKAPVRLDGIGILAVDDNEDNRVLFSIILKSLGANVRLAESAAEALLILKDYSPNIILSDISMPGEDGFSLLKKIQIREADQKRKTPVIALTAHAGQEDIKRVLDAGFSAHIAKPVEKTLLSNVIKNLTST